MMAALILSFLLVLPLILRIWVHRRVRSKVYTLNQIIPPTEIGIVLGAGLWADGSPTPVLYDRVATGVDLYKSAKVNKLLMSGTGKSDAYNEPQVMQQLAISLGVPSEKIILDYAGHRTYDTFYRAREIHNVVEAIVITQRFHLDRALYLCDALGINARGVAADRRRYRFLALQRSRMREIAATALAWIDIHFLRPHPDPRNKPLPERGDDSQPD
jgi:vancomycin permeability regulator SanA